MFNIIKRCSIALLSFVAAVGAPAVAQDDGLSEIVVTAQRREQSILDIPSALGVVDPAR